MRGARSYCRYFSMCISWGTFLYFNIGCAQPHFSVFYIMQFLLFMNPTLILFMKTREKSKYFFWHFQFSYTNTTPQKTRRESPLLRDDFFFFRLKNKICLTSTASSLWSIRSLSLAKWSDVFWKKDAGVYIRALLLKNSRLNWKLR